MRKILPIILIFCLFATTGCVSKKLAKRGLKYEQAGMYEMAADMFYQSLTKNQKNVDAAIGLKKNGQRVLDDKSLEVHKAYFNGNDRETVYKFIDAKKYLDKISATGVTLNLSQISQGYFDEVKPRYIASLYEEGRLLLDEEKFRESEAKFAEIKRIDPHQQGLDEHMKVAVCEPIYREGLSNLSSSFYRRAYHNFNNIITGHGTYKDTKDLRDEALSKAMITIAIGKTANTARKREIDRLLESKISSSLTNLPNPFIKVVDIGNTQQLIDQQVRGVTVGADIQVGQMYAAKAILNGSIIRYQIDEGKIETVKKNGYLKEEIKKKVKGSEEETVEIRYTKVTYTETKQSNSAVLSYEYKLTSTETGAILVSDAISLTESDNIHYATFEGDRKKLIPGNWEYRERESSKDRIDDNPRAIRELRSLLEANKTIKTVGALQANLIDDMATRVASKIDQYNPEK